MPEGLDLGAMLSKIGENPDAQAMLSSLLGGMSEGSPSPTPPPPHIGGRGGRRKEMLRSLRPYLSTRRCASVDRMIRALELYEIIEETHLLKGDRHV